MDTHQLEALIGDHQGPCISLVLHAEANDRKKMYQTCQKAIQQATALLGQFDADKGVKARLLIKLQEVLVKIPERWCLGWGVYISPNHDDIVPFPFNVQQTVVIGRTFERRDLLSLLQYSAHYYTLLITNTCVRLFCGLFDTIHEVRDDIFPVAYRNMYEYQPASTAARSGYISPAPGKERSGIPEIRLKAVFREAAGQLRARLAPDEKVFLAGTQRAIRLFHEVGGQLPIVGKISGPFGERTFDQFQEAAWRECLRSHTRDVTQQVGTLERKTASQRAVGLVKAWSAAAQGKGSLLLVEKDLHCSGFTRAAHDVLYLQPPRKPYEVIPDAVDELIDTVRSYKGKVIYTENGQLKKFGHVALMLE